MHSGIREDLGDMHAAAPALNAVAPKVIIFPAVLYIDIAANPEPRPFPNQRHGINVIATDESTRQEVIHADKPTRVSKLLNRRVSEPRRASAQSLKAHFATVRPEPIIRIQGEDERGLRGIEPNIPCQSEARIGEVAEH